MSDWATVTGSSPRSEEADTEAQNIILWCELFWGSAGTHRYATEALLPRYHHIQVASLEKGTRLFSVKSNTIEKYQESPGCPGLPPLAYFITITLLSLTWITKICWHRKEVTLPVVYIFLVCEGPLNFTPLIFATSCPTSSSLRSFPSIVPSLSVSSLPRCTMSLHLHSSARPTSMNPFLPPDCPA